MALIRFPLLFTGANGQKTITTMIDSGTNVSRINPNSFEGIAAPVKLKTTIKIPEKTKGHFVEANYSVMLSFYINDKLLSDEFFVVPSLREEATLGANLFKKYGIILNFKGGIIAFSPRIIQQN